MAETFYGPWRIQLYQPYSSPYPLQSVLIAGSGNTDGRYLLEYFNPVDVSIVGQEWTLSVEKSDSADVVEWEAVTARKRMEVRPDIGLTILLDIPFPNDPSGESLALELICTSLDETINPPRRPNPYDFTYTPQD